MIAGSLQEAVCSASFDCILLRVWAFVRSGEERAGIGEPSDAAIGHGKSPPKRPSFRMFNFARSHWGGQRHFLPRVNLSAPQTPRGSLAGAIQISVGPCRHLHHPSVWGTERCGSWSRQIAPPKTFVSHVQLRSVILGGSDIFCRG